MTTSKKQCGFTWAIPSGFVRCTLETNHTGYHEGDVDGRLTRYPLQSSLGQPPPGLIPGGIMELGPNGVRFLPITPHGPDAPQNVHDFLSRLGIHAPQPPSGNGEHGSRKPPRPRSRRTPRNKRSAPLDAMAQLTPGVESDSLLHKAMGGKPGALPSSQPVLPPPSPSGKRLRLLSRELKEIQAQNARTRRTGEAWFKACVVPEAKAIIAHHGMDAAAWIVKALLLEMLASVNSIRSLCQSSSEFDDRLLHAMEAVRDAEAARVELIEHVKKHHG